MEKSPEAREEVLRGQVRRVTFRNPQNGYSVIQLETSGTAQPITVVGTCLKVGVGAHLLLRGAFRDHPRFGRQFEATAITETAPSSPEAIQKYLSSGIIKGIGEKTAERLVNTFGADALEPICQRPEEDAAVSGVGRKKAEMLRAALTSQQEMREIFRFLVEHHISPHLSQQIFERYGTKAVEVLSRDPYLLARQMRGVGFITADMIAMNLGLAPDSPQRLKAGLFYALEKALDDCHCYLPAETLLEKAQAPRIPLHRSWV